MYLAFKVYRTQHDLSDFVRKEMQTRNASNEIASKQFLHA